MTLEEVETALAAVNAAITKCLEAQSYAVGGRSKVSAQYKDLVAERNRLDRMKSRLSSTNGGAATNPIFGARGGTSERNDITP